MKKFLVFLCAIFLVAGMFTASQYTYETHALSEEEAAWVAEARLALREMIAEREVMALVYLSDEYGVREAAGEESSVVKTVYSGHTVYIEDVEINDNYEAWAYVRFYSGGREYRGYVSRANLACSDERFLMWESDYGMNPGAAAVYTIDAADLSGNTDVSGNVVTSTNGIDQFPESYQKALKELVANNPEAANWTFVKQVTNLDWDTVIDNELINGRSLVYKSLPAYTKEGAYDTGSWFYASRDILEYYMDPRNGLTMDAIFQFEQLTYNEECHTLEAVESFLNNTFMNSSQPAPGMDNMTYAYIFWAIGAEEGRQVSPFHLVARVLQEQGNGTSPLISGNYEGAGGIYKGYYNYFNVGATGTTDTEVIENGLKYAKNAYLDGKPQPWNNAYYSILGGANVISANYIRKGQDTLYLQKFNVGPDSHYAHYTHQYMQNISAPTSEAKSMKKLYQSADALGSTFVFKIPVYENMPEETSEYPQASTNVVLQIPDGYNTTVYLDAVPCTPEKRNGRYITAAKDGSAKSAVVFKYDASGVPTGMYVWTLEYKNNAYTATAQPDLTDLLTYHGFSIRIVGKSGIRFKTGISAELRNQLTTTGVNGYTLKEYGTLVMKNANRGTYPMIKDGEKVLSGMAYGTNSEGKLQDNIFETVDNRYRYTSVLVGMPASEYKTDYAFGGYAVLEKDGQTTTIYGPVVARSIYTQAQRLLNSGYYAKGSSEDVFLRTLIADGDAAAAGQ